MVIEVIAYETRFGSLHRTESDAEEVEHKEALSALSDYLIYHVEAVCPMNTEDVRKVMKYVVMVISVDPGGLVTELMRLGFLDEV